MTFVKVCGITTREQARWAVELGYDAIGIMQYEKSPRYINAEVAHQLIQEVAGEIATVAVGMRYSDIKEIADQVDYLQLYEPFADPRLILAGSEDPGNREFRYFLYDASHGQGHAVGTLPQWIDGIRNRLIIAGGLAPENVKSLIERYTPFGVDVSSSVEERQGVKDYEKMKSFIEEVRNATG